MKKFLSIAIAAILIAAFPHVAKAQVKAGPATVAHFDLDSLLEIMPAMKKAQDSANAYYQQLENQLYTMQAEFERKAGIYDSLKSVTSPLINAMREKELNDLQYNIQLFQQKAQQDYANMRATLVEPIYNSIIKAVKEVAIANGFKYVIDSSKSAGVVLYASKDYDIFDAVCTKLGIPKPAAPKPATPAPGAGK
jgi:outer membrane protein